MISNTTSERVNNKIIMYKNYMQNFMFIGVLVIEQLSRTKR